MRAAVSVMGSRRRARQAQGAADQLLGRLSVGVAQELLGLDRRVPELEQAVACQQSGILGLAAPREDRPAPARGAVAAGKTADGLDLLPELDDDPFGRALADARHGLEADGVARGDRRDQL